MARFLRRVFVAVFLLAFFAAAAGCDDEGEHAGNSGKAFADAYGKDDTWLIQWYLCGTDLESGNGAATNDLGELMEVELPPNVKVLIEAGGAHAWNNDIVPDGKVCRYLYDSEGLHELGEVRGADMGTPDTLAEFLRHGQENYAADHRVFVFWDHGGGSAVGVCYDERTQHMLRLNDIRQAFASVYTPAPGQPPFELVGFDACLMATYDTANTLYGLTRYMVGSEELEPGNGWYYTGWVGELAKNPAMGGARLGQAICDSYMEGCEEYGTEDEATQSLIDMAKLPALRAAYEAFGVEALENAVQRPKKFFSAFAREARAAENYGGNTRDQGFSDMVDLADLAKGSADLLPNTSARLAKAVDDAVIYKVNGMFRDQGSGISGFYSYDSDEDSFGLYADQDAAPLSHKLLYFYRIYGELPEGALEAARASLAESEAAAKEQAAAPAQTMRAMPAPGKQRGKIFDVSSLEDLAVDVDKDGNAFFRLSEDQMDLLSGIHCNLVAMDLQDDLLIYLGSDADINADWDKGLFKDNFRGVWPMLDGHPVYVEISAEEDGYNLYSIPIKLNGQECNLKVSYTFEDQAYRILGARRGLDSNGLADRNLIKLKKGDRVTTIHYAMSISGDDEDFQPVEAETFTIGDAPKIEDMPLGDGDYGYLFEFVSPSGDSALSKVVQFALQGGSITTSVE